MRWPLLACVIVAAACSIPVQHGLEENAANEVVTALERGGIGAEKERDEGTGATTFTVKVAQSEATRALELMRTVGLPRGTRQGFSEMYGQPSLVPSATEERARYLEALGNEIERTIESVDGVVSARVHIVLPETDPFAPDGKPRVPAQAAVLLKTRPGGPIPIKDSDVQRLVAGSVPGLAPASVAVVVTSAPESWAAAPPTLTALGPLRVSPGTRPVLLAALGVALALLAGMATVVLLMARRLASSGHRADDDRDGPG